MFMIHYRALSWWYWLVTACLLSAGLAGYPAAFALATLFTAFQAVHFAVREKSAKAFPVQVRLGYLVLMLALYPEPLRLLYWAPALGTWAQLIFGYCMMARMVSLLPWNRKERLSVDLLRRTFFTPPVAGNILHGLPPPKPAE